MVSVTAAHAQVDETMATEMPDVQLMSLSCENEVRPRPDCRWELIDSAELATRWRVPESWIRSHTRARTPRAERIPRVRLGRYVRFEWGSPRREEWLSRKRQ